MEKKRFIFDLDHTLMTADYGVEKEYFKSVLGDNIDSFTKKIPLLLEEYETNHPRYEIDLLSEFLIKRTGFNINENVIRGWIDSFGNCPSVIEDGVFETLEYLKSNDYSLVVLTNWFLDSQNRRLKNSGLREYFDGVYAGDCVLKPRQMAYQAAMDIYKPGSCVYIGDNLEKDYIGPRICGIDAVLYDKNDKHNDNIVKIKRMNELKKIY